MLSILVGMGFIYLNLRNEIHNNRKILLYYLLYAVCALIFGKYYTAFMYGGFSFLKAGLSAYGGLIGVIIASLIFEKIIPLEGKLIDASVLSLPLVYGLSKIACFFAGGCGGIIYDGFLSVCYPNDPGVSTFPVQLLETVVSLLVFAVCFLLKKKKGIRYVTLFLTASVKFLLDFLRYDHMTKLITPNQIFSIFLMAVSILIPVVIYLRKGNFKTNKST